MSPYSSKHSHSKDSFFTKSKKNHSFFNSKEANSTIQSKEEKDSPGSTALNIRNDLRSSSSADTVIQKMGGYFDESEFGAGKMSGSNTGKMGSSNSSYANLPFTPVAFPDMSQYQPGLSYPWVHQPSNTKKVDSDDGLFSNVMKSFWG